MVINKFVECTLCHTKHQIRWQIGNNEANFIIQCPKCKAKLRGMLSDKGKTAFKDTLLNCKEIEEENVDYISEVSTEFYIKKMTKKQTGVYDISPFMRSVDQLEDLDKANSYIAFAQNIKKYQNEISTVSDLFNNDSYEYLKTKLLNEHNPFIEACRAAINYKYGNELDILMSVHQYLHAILTKLELKGTENNIKIVNNKVNSIIKSNPQVTIDFCNELNSRNVFSEINQKFASITDCMIQEYNNLLPIYINQDLRKVDLNTFGISTLDIDSLINIYKKIFEFVGEYLYEVVGLNNLNSRGHYNQFTNENENIFEKFLSITSKTNRFSQLLKDGDYFSIFFKDKFNNIIRNSEAHFSFEIDGLTQMITFVNKHNDIVEEEKMYLLEFGACVISVYQIAFLLFEINYQLHKYFLISTKYLFTNITIKK